MDSPSCQQAEVRGRKGLEIHKKMNTFSYFQTLSENHKMSHLYISSIYIIIQLYPKFAKIFFFNPLTLFVKVRVGDDVIFVSVATER